eukprot:TRINITY_DN866_c0_g1_i1.p1 TRINITY_DN866_c0_g1~~TRINITY_DN866_c0_g1_i1.p1  ORF type:complete len:154 (+),score=34.39 TRINITY_DN866_c0_g1_i1:606-1067(+)
MFKNQDYKFTENEKNKLFATVQTYYGLYNKQANKDNTTLVVELLDDALKMPFSIFSTKHKKTLLKWHTELSGQDPKTEGTATDATETQCSVIDLSDDGYLTVLLESGETKEGIKVTDQQQLKAIRVGLDNGQDVVVTIATNDGVDELVEVTEK